MFENFEQENNEKHEAFATSYRKRQNKTITNPKPGNKTRNIIAIRFSLEGWECLGFLNL